MLPLALTNTTDVIVTWIADQSSDDASLMTIGTLTDCGDEVAAVVPPPPPQPEMTAAAAIATAVKLEAPTTRCVILDVMSFSFAHANRVAERYVQIAHSVNRQTSQVLQTSARRGGGCEKVRETG